MSAVCLCNFPDVTNNGSINGNFCRICGNWWAPQHGSKKRPANKAVAQVANSIKSQRPGTGRKHSRRLNPERLLAAMQKQQDQLDEIHSRNCTLARRAIIARHQENGSTFGSMICPICKTGNLHWRIEPNGHVHAGCETSECVAWRE